VKAITVPATIVGPKAATWLIRPAMAELDDSYSNWIAIIKPSINSQVNP
jgi:hypothetical protein